MTTVYFLSLLAVVYGGLIIDIDVRTEPPFIDVRHSMSTNVISDAERETFGINDAQLKKAVAKYTKDNTEPDFVYVKKTGEKNDLYANYPNFREIIRAVQPKYVDAKIENNCGKISPATSIKIDWEKNGNLTIAGNITHNVYFDNKNETYVFAWGTGEFKPIPIPSEHGEFQCMIVTIEYEVTIAGDVAADYTKPRKSTDGNSDHHYYAYDVVNVQEAAGLRKSVICSEKITVVYPKKKETTFSNSTTETNSNVSNRTSG